MFLSCSQVEPKIEYAKPVVVFEYSNTNRLPQQRLSVFVESKSDVRRISKIKVISNETKLEWISTDLQKIDISERMYVGNSNFVVPNNMSIPSGNYTFIYSNEDQKETSIDFTLDYDKKLKDITLSQIDEYALENKYIKNIVIYDSDLVCIFYGLEPESMKNKKDIIKQYKNAVYYKTVWVNSNNTVFCILPVRYITDNK